MTQVTVTGSKPVWATVEAVVTRADGRVERLGLVSFHHRNPVINAVGNLYISVKRKIFG